MPGCSGLLSTDEVSQGWCELCAQSKIKDTREVVGAINDVTKSVRIHKASPRLKFSDTDCDHSLFLQPYIMHSNPWDPACNCLLSDACLNGETWLVILESVCCGRCIHWCVGPHSPTALPTRDSSPLHCLVRTPLSRTGDHVTWQSDHVSLRTFQWNRISIIKKLSAENEKKLFRTLSSNSELNLKWYSWCFSGVTADETVGITLILILEFSQTIFCP